MHGYSLSIDVIMRNMLKLNKRTKHGAISDPNLSPAVRKFAPWNLVALQLHYSSRYFLTQSKKKILFQNQLAYLIDIHWKERWDVFRIAMYTFKNISREIGSRCASGLDAANGFIVTWFHTSINQGGWQGDCMLVVGSHGKFISNRGMMMNIQNNGNLIHNSTDLYSTTH